MVQMNGEKKRGLHVGKYSFISKVLIMNFAAILNSEIGGHKQDTLLIRVYTQILHIEAVRVSFFGFQDDIVRA